LAVKNSKPAKKTRDTDGRKAAPGKAPPEKPERVKLEKELRAATAELDEKGLLFLLRQAQVLIHNARLESLSGAQRQAAAPAAAAPAPAPVRHPETVSIEDGGKTIFLNIGRARKVLARDEMKRLVRICYGAETRSEALQQLFTVLVKERRDILTDAVIGGPDSPLLRSLFTAVREKYQLPER
jgi:hypothetical protein